MFLKFYEGSFNYVDILKMPYDRFMMFYEYMIYIQNMESEEGRKENARKDKALKYSKGISTIDNDILKIKQQLKGQNGRT